MTTASTTLTLGAPYVPETITGLLAWYDFSETTTLFTDTNRTTVVASDGDTIKGMTDRSGNGYHLSEATNAPTYEVNVVNGRSVGRFNGTNDVLSVANGMGMSGADIPYTALAAYIHATTADISAICGWGGVDASEYVIPIGHWLASDGIWVGRHDGATESAIADAATADTAWGITTTLFPGTTVTMRRNGAATAVTGNAADVGTIGVDSFHIGAVDNGSLVLFAEGDIAEVLIYDHELTLSEVVALERYLGAKYGITVP